MGKKKCSTKIRVGHDYYKRIMSGLSFRRPVAIIYLEDKDGIVSPQGTLHD